MDFITNLFNEEDEDDDLEELDSPSNLQDDDDDDLEVQDSPIDFDNEDDDDEDELEDGGIQDDDIDDIGEDDDDDEDLDDEERESTANLFNDDEEEEEEEVEEVEQEQEDEEEDEEDVEESDDQEEKQMESSTICLNAYEEEDDDESEEEKEEDQVLPSNQYIQDEEEEEDEIQFSKDNFSKVEDKDVLEQDSIKNKNDSKKTKQQNIFDQPEKISNQDLFKEQINPEESNNDMSKLLQSSLFPESHIHQQLDDFQNTLQTKNNDSNNSSNTSDEELDSDLFLNLAQKSFTDQLQKFEPKIEQNSDDRTDFGYDYSNKKEIDNKLFIRQNNSIPSQINIESQQEQKQDKIQEYQQINQNINSKQNKSSSLKFNQDDYQPYLAQCNKFPIDFQNYLINNEGGIYKLPYESPEGGAPTIGCGHKIKPNESFKNGLTIDQSINQFHKDLEQGQQDAIQVSKEKGYNFNQLSQEQQLMMTEYGFMLGKSNLSKFNRFIKALYDNDWETVEKEYKLHYTKNGKKKEMTQRNQQIANYYNLKEKARKQKEQKKS